MNILLVDIETSPNIAYVWGAWKQNVGQQQWLQRSFVMSYAYKWLGETNVHYEENRTTDDKQIISSLFRLLDKADIVIAHNGDKFDLPVILGRGLVHGLNPPSPYHTVDTLRISRKRFRFNSNSLANLAEELGLTEKKVHKKFPGFKLWKECLAGNPEAWKEMKTYNIQDVGTLEELYLTLRPYINNHPNVVQRTQEGKVHCVKCGSDDIQYRGYYHTKMGLAYRKFACKCCGGWGRERYSEKDIIINNGRNAV